LKEIANGNDSPLRKKNKIIDKLTDLGVGISTRVLSSIIIG